MRLVLVAASVAVALFAAAPGSLAFGENGFFAPETPGIMTVGRAALDGDGIRFISVR